MIRLFIVLAVIGWYVCVRSIVFYYFLGGGEQGRMYFFEWWWSWGIAVPVTALSVFFTGILFFLVIPWVIDGF